MRIGQFKLLWKPGPLPIDSGGRRCRNGPGRWRYRTTRTGQERTARNRQVDWTGQRLNATQTVLSVVSEGVRDEHSEYRQRVMAVQASTWLRKKSGMRASKQYKRNANGN